MGAVRIWEFGDSVKRIVSGTGLPWTNRSHLTRLLFGNKLGIIQIRASCREEVIDKDYRINKEAKESTHYICQVRNRKAGML